MKSDLQDKCQKFKGLDDLESIEKELNYINWDEFKVGFGHNRANLYIVHWVFKV